MPRSISRRALILAAPLWTLSAWATAPTPAPQDRLDRPAPQTLLHTSTQLSAITNTGQRLIAVGVRGLIIGSDDQGRTWRQLACPVTSDLLGLHFPTPTKGWIVGHDGVVLHSADGGLSWSRQLDGRSTARLLQAHFAARAAAGDTNAARLADEVKLNYENGPEQALMDVWFEDERQGFVVGSFGTILHTSDGGKTWNSWMEYVESPTMVHYNAIRGIAGEIYMASEKGIVFRLDRARQRFVARSTGYGGSFFALAGNEHTLLAIGLRGNAYRSRDQGLSWERVNTGIAASLTGATRLADGRLALVSQNGRLLLEAADQFAASRVERPTLLTGIAQASADTVVLVGLNGVQIARLR